MRRPAKKDKYSLKPQLIDEYVEDLEKYCDELEKKLTKLEQALDKASQFIEGFGDCPKSMFEIDMDCEERCATEHTNCWKEWFMKEGMVYRR